MHPHSLIDRLDEAAKHHVTACGDGNLHWREWGTGPSVVLLHGGFGSWLHWIRNIEALAEHFRVFAIDLPGLGDSDAPPEPVSPQSLARLVVGGLVQIVPDEGRCHLAGFSFGGLIGGHVAAALGPKAHTLVLVGASGLGLPRRRIELLRRTPGMSDEDRRNAQRHNVAALMVHDRTNVDDLALAIQARNDERARMKSRRMSLSDSLRQVLPSVNASLKGIWGEHDVTATPGLVEHRRLLLDLHPETDFRAIEGAVTGCSTRQPIVSTHCWWRWYRHRYRASIEIDRRRPEPA